MRVVLAALAAAITISPAVGSAATEAPQRFTMRPRTDYERAFRCTVGARSLSYMAVVMGGDRHATDPEYNGGLDVVQALSPQPVTRQQVIAAVEFEVNALAGAVKVPDNPQASMKAVIEAAIKDFGHCRVLERHGVTLPKE